MPKPTRLRKEPPAKTKVPEVEALGESEEEAASWSEEDEPMLLWRKLSV